MFRLFIGSIDQFLGHWVQENDGAVVTCAPTSHGDLQCLIESAHPSSLMGSGKHEYFISGTRITWKKKEEICGTLNNQKDRITWTTGNTWIKQGNILNIHLLILTLY